MTQNYENYKIYKTTVDIPTIILRTAFRKFISTFRPRFRLNYQQVSVVRKIDSIIHWIVIFSIAAGIKHYDNHAGILTDIELV